MEEGKRQEGEFSHSVCLSFYEPLSHKHCSCLSCLDNERSLTTRESATEVAERRKSHRFLDKDFFLDPLGGGGHRTQRKQGLRPQCVCACLSVCTPLFSTETV